MDRRRPAGVLDQVRHDAADAHRVVHHHDVPGVLDRRPRRRLDRGRRLGRRARGAPRPLDQLDRVEEIIQVPAEAIDEVETPGQQRLTPRVARVAGETVLILSPEALDPGRIIR